MLTHAQVWTAIEGLAARSGLSVSALAKKAGLDPTTFNKSKRVTADGRERWPSTESLAKALAATGTSIDALAGLIADGARTAAQTLPLIALADAAGTGYFDAHGFPAADRWDELTFPALDDKHAFALEISGDALRPAYRDGDIIVVSPAAPVRRGDRVLIKTCGGEVLIRELRRRSVKGVETATLNGGHDERMRPITQIQWLARIVWASQ